MDNLIRPNRPNPHPLAKQPQKTIAPKVNLPIKKKKSESLGYFQAIGVISGEVDFKTREISLEGNNYQLYYAPKHKGVFDLMQKQAVVLGSCKFRLLVYPKVTHFPKREQEFKMSFQVISFYRSLGSDEDDERGSGRIRRGAFDQFKDFEFRLNGLWQFIPVCKTPVITIQRNFTEDRLKHIKESDSLRRVRFLKASHVPLRWADAPKPFRFNPKSETSDRAKFVEVKANLNPSRNMFYCMEQIGEISESVPRSLSALKSDKVAALQMVQQAKA